MTRRAPILISRRRLLEAGMGLVAARQAFAVGEADAHLPGLKELIGAALVRRLNLSQSARIERLGVSRAGRPIELISIGRGSRNALIVAAPHANEPIGCATIVRMLTRLGQDRALRDGSDWQWHFIPAIDIDGLALNEGWFEEPLRFDRYLTHFYRPPFRLQPEYAFPLHVPHYDFDDETPESACWRRALDHLRPQLQCSLHGADTGGSFFLVSELRSNLAAELARLPEASGISLNMIGEASAGLAPLAPGVFSFPDVAAMIARAAASGRRPDLAWNAGDSSAGYSGKRFGTFNMVCEVPLWRDAREGDSRSSGRALAQVRTRKRDDARGCGVAEPVSDEPRCESEGPGGDGIARVD